MLRRSPIFQTASKKPFFRRLKKGESIEKFQTEVSVALWKEFQIANPQLRGPTLKFKVGTEAETKKKKLKDDRFASKIGGLPFFPQNEKWNKKEMGGLKLFAQINLSRDVTAAQRTALGLPNDGGLLAFF